MPAQFLLRFDDLCPTVSHARWRRLAPLIEEFGIQPILAVVPDNQDHDLQHSPPDPGFWDCMRKMEAAGATIALHGFHHVCNSKGRSLVPLHRHTEFAGVPEETQRQWIRAGLKILRGQGLNPRIWVAPRHGFDRTTLRVLRHEGIKLLSDGFARVPFTRRGLTWIPQQLWEPQEKPKGLWTICLHINTARLSMLNELRDFLARHRAQFTSVDRVLTEFQPSRLGPSEWLYETFAEWRARVAKMEKRHARRFRTKHKR
jgi:predicted deacetylase